jgi:phosphoglycolate phosphatase
MPSPFANNIRAFIFDLDGTLIDSKTDLVNSVNAVLRELGRHELPAETVASYVGHGAPQLIASALGPDCGDADRKAALSAFLAHYEKHNLDATRAYPGVEEALAALSQYPMAVLTNKPQNMSRQILEGLGLTKFFSAIYGGDSFPSKKPDPSGVLSILNELATEPEHAAMIGDSDVDIQTARNASMQAIAVTYGFGNYDRRANPADLYLDRLSELVTSCSVRHP